MFRISLRAKGIVLALILVFFGVQPILESDSGGGSSSEHGLLDGEIALACYDSADAGRDADEVAAYLERRPDEIDALLPDARGATRFVASLGGDKAGIAMQDAGIVAIAVDKGLDEWRTPSVELHERAHLMSFWMPDLAARLMNALPAPSRGEYAATNSAEHFAEMAGRAWDVVSALSPEGFCPVETPLDLLRSSETNVPGTAGFVAWYLRHPSFRTADGAIELAREAERLIAPQIAEWKAMWSLLEARRLADGTLRPFERPSALRSRLELRRAHARLAGGFSGNLESVQLAMSLALLGVSGR